MGWELRYVAGSLTTAGQKGELGGVDFTSSSYFYLELGKLCKPGSKKDLSRCLRSLSQDTVSSPCLFFFFWRGESPLGYSPTFPPNFPPMWPFLGEGSASSSLPVTKNFGRRCLGPAPSSNCPRDFRPPIYFLTPGSRHGPHSLWACLLCSQGLVLPFWLWWGWLGGSGVLRVSPWDPA